MTSVTNPEEDDFGGVFQDLRQWVGLRLLGRVGWSGERERERKTSSRLERWSKRGRYLRPSVILSYRAHSCDERDGFRLCLSKWLTH